jgi:hypothetical protein
VTRRNGGAPSVVPEPSRASDRVLADLVTLPALPLGDVARVLNLPESSLQKIRAQGRGPKTFLIGRRLFVRQADLRAWLDALAEANEPASQRQQADERPLTAPARDKGNGNNPRRSTRRNAAIAAMKGNTE